MIDFEENTPNPITMEEIHSLFMTGNYTLDELAEKSRGKFSRTSISNHLKKKLTKYPPIKQ